MMFFFFQAEDGIRDLTVTGVQTCALPICTTRATSPMVTGALPRMATTTPWISCGVRSRPMPRMISDCSPRRIRPPPTLRLDLDRASLTSSSDRPSAYRSEEHTSELQSQSNLVCRLLLEKKNDK